MLLLSLALFISAVSSIAFPNAPDSHKNLSKRATDEEFSTSIHQMQMISRITNGIYLQQGVTKGTIPTDELISELLNFGNVKPSDIENINTDKLKNVVDKIQGLPKQFVAKTKKMEDRLVTLSSVVDVSSKVDKLEILGDDYLKKVARIKDSKMVFNVLENYVIYLSIMLSKMETLKTKKKTVMKTPEIQDLINKVRDSSQPLKSGNLSNFKSELTSDVLSSNEVKFAPLQTFHTSLKKFSENHQVMTYNQTNDDKLLESVGKNIKSISDVIAQIQNDLSDFHILEQLFVKRHHRSGNKYLKFSTGFPNGPSELNLIFNDLKNSWTQKFMYEQADSWATALNSLKSVYDKGVAVEETLGDDKNEKVSMVSSISTKVQGLKQLDNASKVPIDKLKEIQKAAGVSDLLPKNTDGYSKLHENILILFKQLAAFKEILQVSEKLILPENTAKLDKIGNLTATFINDGQDQLKQLRDSKELEEIMKIIKVAKSSIEFLKQNFEIKEAASNIVQNFKEMKAFIDSTGPFLTMLSSLRKIGELKSVPALVDAIRRISNDKNTSPGDFNQVGSAINEAKTKLKELEQAISEMKNVKGVEHDALVGLDDISTVSKTIGEATRAISSMERLIVKNLDISTFKLSASMVEQTMEKVHLASNVVSNLKKLTPSITQLDQLLNRLKKFKGTLKPVTSDKLSDYAEIFSKAKVVGGISGDFFDMSISVEVLASKVNNSGFAMTLAQFIPILQDLDKIGLDYSKSHKAFDTSKNTLDTIDLMFSKYQNILTATTPVIKTIGATTKVANVAESDAKLTTTIPQQKMIKNRMRNNLGSESDSGSSRRAKKRWYEKEDNKFLMGLFIPGGTIILFLIGNLIWGQKIMTWCRCPWCKCCVGKICLDIFFRCSSLQKKKEQKEKEKQNKKKPVTTQPKPTQSASTPVTPAATSSNPVTPAATSSNPVTPAATSSNPVTPAASNTRTPAQLV